MSFIIEHAKVELARIDFGEDDSRVMVEMLEKFFDRWDSGAAVSVAAPVLMRLLAGKPLSPLTGEDDEWIVQDNGKVLQNTRCTTVFKSVETGVAHDIQSDLTPITFPYLPPW
jgi:hypothetical protein